VKLSQIFNKPQNLRPEDFWLWFPIMAEAFNTVVEEGLVEPFLFGHRRSATSLRLPPNYKILRIQKSALDPNFLYKDISLDLAKKSCINGCWWDGKFRRWLNSLPLKPEDIITRWVSGKVFNSTEEMKLVVKQLDHLDKRGMWFYNEKISPKHISLLHPNGYYVSIGSFKKTQ